MTNMVKKYKCVNPQCLVVINGPVDNNLCGFCGGQLEGIKEDDKP